MRFPRLVWSNPAPRPALARMSAGNRALLHQFESDRDFAYGVLSRALESPRYFAAGRMAMGGDPNAVTLLRQVYGWHDIAARVIADYVMQLPLRVGVRDSDGKFAEIPEHRFAQTLARPTQHHTGGQLFRLVSMWLSTVGEAFLLKVHDRSRRVQELWPLQPDMVSPILDEQGIIAWRFQPFAQWRDYPVEDVVRLWFPSPQATLVAQGAFAPQATAADADRFLGETMREFWGHDATPKFALLADESKGARAPDPRAKKRFYSEWIRKFNRRRGALRGTPVFLPNGFSVHEFAQFAGFTEVRAMAEFYRDHLLMTHRVPPFVLGKDTNVNRATGETTLWAFERHAVKPITTVIEQALTPVAQEFHPRLLCSYPEFVSADKEFELAREAQDLSTGVRVVNEIRAQRDLEPVDWGDLPRANISDVPYTGEDREPLPVDDPNALDAGADEVVQ